MSTSITTGMNTPLANLARQSAIKTDPGGAPPPPNFRDDTSYEDAFGMDDASDSHSGDIQHIKPAAVKPTLDLKNWTFEYVATNYLIPGLHLDFDHIVDTTISADTVNEKLATIISAGQYMEAHKQDTMPTSTMNDPRYDRHQSEPAERRVNASYGHNQRDNYNYQAPPAALASHVLHAEHGALRGDPPPTLPPLTDAPILQLPTSLVVDHVFLPCHQQHSVNRQPSPRPTAPYVLVVIDAWKGPCPSVTGAQRIFGAVDSYTGVKVAITMRTKDEAVRAVHQLHAAVLGIGHAIQRIRADRGAVYTGSPFRQACDDLNIALDFTASHSHHQAGMAERSFRTIGECSQAMLLHAGHDCTFWDWAYLHAVYLCNRQWGSSVNAIPYTLMTGRKPDLTDLHIFGCVAWVNIPVPVRTAKGKMTPKSWPGIYVGHHEDTAGYRIYNPVVRHETTTRDVIFDEAPRNYKGATTSNYRDDWKQSMDREIASISKMETFVWISVPELRRNNPSAIIIQTAWAFAEKHDKDVNLIKRKARVVVRGDQLIAGDNYDDTKTYAPVARFIALRTTIALAFQLDWELYQTPKAWFLRFSSFLHDFGLINSECDPGVWTMLAADGSLLAILCVYVDDIMLATSPLSNIRELFQTSLFTVFDATTDGLCTWLLGMAIDRKPCGVIHLHQEKYINDILTTFNMTECTPRRLP
eukprot:jgi/Tetstr1/463163/TSEL_008097.t1